MKIRPLNAFYIMSIVLCTLAALLVAIQEYYFFDFYTLEYFLSFSIFGMIILYHINNNCIVSLEVIFNLFGLLYTNYYIGQMIVENIMIEQVYYEAMMLSHLAMLCFNIAYVISKPLDLKKYFGDRGDTVVCYDEGKLFIYNLIFFLLALSAEYYVVFYKIGLYVYFFATRASKSLLSTDYSILSFYKFVIPVSAVIFLFLYLKYKNKKGLLFFFVAFFVSLFNALISASRTEMMAIVLPVICLMYLFGKISGVQVAIVGILGVLLFGTWKALLGDNTVNISFDGELNTWYGIFKDVTRSSSFYFRYGESYFDTMMNLIVPITETIPLSEWYMETFEAYIQSIGGGRGFSGVLEAYVNFGVTGCAIVYGFYGWLFKQIKKETDFQIIIYLIIMISMHQFFRSESYSVWKNMMWFKIYPIAFIFFLSRKYKDNILPIVELNKSDKNEV